MGDSRNTAYGASKTESDREMSFSSYGHYLVIPVLNHAKECNSCSIFTDLSGQGQVSLHTAVVPGRINQGPVDTQKSNTIPLCLQEIKAKEQNSCSIILFT